MSLDDLIIEEVERRLAAQLKEEGEDEFSDSDHAMFLRQDLRLEVEQEFAKKTNIDRLKQAVEDGRE